MGRIPLLIRNFSPNYNRYSPEILPINSAKPISFTGHQLTMALGEQHAKCVITVMEKSTESDTIFANSNTHAKLFWFQSKQMKYLNHLSSSNPTVMFIHSAILENENQTKPCIFLYQNLFSSGFFVYCCPSCHSTRTQWICGPWFKSQLEDCIKCLRQDCKVPLVSLFFIHPLKTPEAEWKASALIDFIHFL